MWRAVVFCILSLFILASQPLSQQAPAGKGSIEGTVLRSDTGAPIPDAQVTLTPVAGGQPTGTAVQQRRTAVQPVTTSFDGKFVFKDLDAGGYRLEATADGFVRQAYGQGAFRLTQGQIVKDSTIRLIAAGVVSGRVVDDNGQPAIGAPVRLLRSMYNAVGRVLEAVAEGVTDDRGDYRISGVPGRYFLLAGTPPGGGGTPPGRGGGIVGNASSERFSLVYYPNASEVGQASAVDVKSGTNAAIDMRVRRQNQTYRVRGRIVDATGAGLPATLTFSLLYRFLANSGSIGGRNPTYNSATGAFELQNVHPGDYTIQAMVPDPLPFGNRTALRMAIATRPSGQAAIRVVDADVEGIVLTLSSGVTANGTVSVEGRTVASVPGIERLRLEFPSTGLPFYQGIPVASAVSANGTFQVAGLREDEYRVQIENVPQGYYVKSVRYGGDDVLSEPLQFRSSGSGTFDVVLRAGGSQVTGGVTDRLGMPVPGIRVVIIPSERGRTDLYRSVQTDQAGKFTFSGVPPAEYKVFSWEASEDFFDPDVLKQYEQQGRAIKVTDGTISPLDVRLIPAS